ncbi:MAG: 16S rRNA (adenine(1518)-N(6)/adenine(1519)-N(6))-dimethyltransferase RsmA [Gracilibacteraceae bacterium]|jgi:16S rRNA (adenine1518-N6/adenine1519-N6)-dimethyltransferase|nr:16S rRNA (adenine(1518)-N(6)/adenine(1519)-N(6))-dimethyltransferase RsmA [Gracilibacteraceae bacterium]
MSDAQAESALAYLRRAGRGDRAKKSLGQNYLIDDAVLERVAEAALPAAGGPVLEIGPGLGALTRVLLRRLDAAGESDRLWAAELDGDKIAVLRREFAGRSLRLLHADARTVRLADLWGGAKGAVCGNLPYYIANPLLMHFLRQRESLGLITVMVQKEVAERLTAVPGGKAYGVLSVAALLYAETEFLFLVPPEAFHPAPKVTSAVVRLKPRPFPGLLLPEEELLAVARAAFSQRRKTILNSLGVSWPKNRESLRSLLAEAGIPPDTRAERLKAEDFQRLALALRNTQTTSAIL